MQADAALTADARRSLVQWGIDHRRDLPWRRTRDPWSILVSEVMLQQTQVTRVIPAYPAFLERFPDPRRCAEASVVDVVTAWGRLGFPRRAVRLRTAAAAITERHGAEVPDRLDDLLALPGVGAYTARAVLVFAFERDVGVIDTNVGRLLARWLGRSLTACEAQATADASVPVGESWAWNQTMFDLAAAICLPSTPRCDACPVRSRCAWGAAGLAAPDPSVRSTGTSRRQAPFTGSDRQVRGRLMAALRDDGAVPAAGLVEVAGLAGDSARARRVADSLVEDGLAAVDGSGGLTWPGT
jgi:A/G-specific adenine glycosylase